MNLWGLARTPRPLLRPPTLAGLCGAGGPLSPRAVAWRVSRGGHCVGGTWVPQTGRFRGQSPGPSLGTPAPDSGWDMGTGRPGDKELLG